MPTRRRTQHASPGRPREFDVDVAVADAMQVFWEKGYQATSLPDLLEGTKLTRGSLYKAFEDKRTLFFRALDQYALKGQQETAAILSSPGPVKKALRQALLRIAHRSVGAAGRRGCLMLATATELAGHDAEIRNRLGKMFDRRQALYAAAIRRGQESGEIATQQDSSLLASFLLNQVEGMRVMGKVDRNPADIEATVDLALRALA
jgi:TetR/AcrR family transcriptional regulator, transcriptional repressor for nem operon